MNQSDAQQMYLVGDWPRPAAKSNGHASEHSPQPPTADALPVPAGPSLLLATHDQPPRLVSALPGSLPGAVVVEPVINRRGQLRLLMINPKGWRERVNGQLPPRVLLLKE